MIRDLRTILDGWDYEPGKISCRKIVGRDGREKIQTRIDLGVLQIETTGRPDGRRPYGASSLLEYHEQRLAMHKRVHGDETEFTLTPEQCRDLRHEGYLYYQRYLSCFVLEEFDAVEQDTGRNLRLIDFCQEHAATAQDRAALLPQRPYVQMMNSRAKVYRALRNELYSDALMLVEHGIELIRAMHEDAEEAADPPPEIVVLSRLRDEVFERMPADEPIRLQWQLRAALEREDYEEAARIRDQISRRKHVSA